MDKERLLQQTLGNCWRIPAVSRLSTVIRLPILRRHLFSISPPPVPPLCSWWKIPTQVGILFLSMIEVVGAKRGSLEPTSFYRRLSHARNISKVFQGRVGVSNPCFLPSRLFTWMGHLNALKGFVHASIHEDCPSYQSSEKAISPDSFFFLLFLVCLLCRPFVC